jgi:hypothetical protein
LASEEELLNDALSLLAYEQPQASPCGHMLSQVGAMGVGCMYYSTTGRQKGVEVSVRGGGGSMSVHLLLGPALAPIRVHDRLISDSMALCACSY